MNRKLQVIPLILLLTLILTVSLTSWAAQKSPAASPKEPMGDLLLILHADDLASAEAFLLMAGVAAKRGHKVTLLLRVKAIQLALKDTDYVSGNIRFQDKLAGFMKSGSKVLVGGGCMKMEGISKDRLIPGVAVGTPDVVMGLIFGEKTRIISH